MASDDVTNSKLTLCGLTGRNSNQRGLRLSRSAHEEAHFAWNRPKVVSVSIWVFSESVFTVCCRAGMVANRLTSAHVAVVVVVAVAVAVDSWEQGKLPTPFQRPFSSWTGLSVSPRFFPATFSIRQCLAISDTGCFWCLFLTLSDTETIVSECWRFGLVLCFVFHKALTRTIISLFSSSTAGLLMDGALLHCIASNNTVGRLSWVKWIFPMHTLLCFGVKLVRTRTLQDAFTQLKIITWNLHKDLGLLDRSFVRYCGQCPANSGPQRWDLYGGPMRQPRERRGIGRCVRCEI